MSILAASRYRLAEYVGSDHVANAEKENERHGAAWRRGGWGKALRASRDRGSRIISVLFSIREEKNRETPEHGRKTVRRLSFNGSLLAIT